MIQREDRIARLPCMNFDLEMFDLTLAIVSSDTVLYKPQSSKPGSYPFINTYSAIPCTVRINLSMLAFKPFFKRSLDARVPHVTGTDVCL